MYSIHSHIPADVFLLSFHVFLLIEWMLLDPAGMDGDNVLELLLLTALVFVTGITVIFYGVRTYRKYALVKNTPTEDIASMAMGRTELEGTIESAGDLFDRPLSSGRCVYAAWEIEEYRSSGRGSGSWTTVDSGAIGVPFYIDDGTGRVLVEDPSDATATISDANTSSSRLSSGETNYEASSFFAQRGISPNQSRRRRYTEEVIPPGTEGYVFGEANRRPGRTGEDGQPDITIRRDPGSDQFIISDKCEDSLISHYRKWGYLFVFGGIVMSAIGLFFWLQLAPYFIGHEYSLLVLGIGVAIAKGFELAGSSLLRFMPY